MGMCSLVQTLLPSFIYNVDNVVGLSLSSMNCYQTISKVLMTFDLARNELDVAEYFTMETLL